MFSNPRVGVLPMSKIWRPREDYISACLRVPKLLNEEIEQKTIRQFEVHRHKHQSLDYDKESVTEITPAEKVRVLRNGINPVNTQGFLNSRHQIERRDLRFDVHALAAAERFFTINPRWSPADIIRVMIRCERMDDESSIGTYDEYWHARNGNDLRFLLCNLDSVLQGFGMVDALPSFEPVAKEVLFPGSTRRSGNPADPVATSKPIPRSEPI